MSPAWAKKRGAPSRGPHGGGRPPILISIDGVERTFDAWCREYRIGKTTVRYRLSRGMTLQRALKAPRARRASARGEQMVTVTVTVEPAIAQATREEARRRGTSVSALVRDGLRLVLGDSR